MNDTLQQITDFSSVSLEIIFYTALLVFTIYTLMLTYHWFSYGTKHTLSMLSLAIFLLGSAPLFLIMAITL